MPPKSMKRQLEDADSVIAKRVAAFGPMEDKTVHMWRSRLNQLANSGNFESVEHALRTAVPRVWMDSMVARQLAPATVHAYMDTAAKAYKSLVEMDARARGGKPDPAMEARYTLWSETHVTTSDARAAASRANPTNTEDDPTDQPGRTRPTREQLLADMERFGAKLGKGSAHFAYTAFQATGPPRRNADFDKLRLATSAPKSGARENTLVIRGTKATLHLYDHKTVKAIGPVVIELPDEQAKQVIASAKAKPRDYYLIDKDGQPVKSLSTLVQTSHRTSDVLYGCNVFRRNYADKLITKEMDGMLREFAALSKKLVEVVLPVAQPASVAMGNSPGVICTEYRKGNYVWTEEARLALHALFQRKTLRL